VLGVAGAAGESQASWIYTLVTSFSRPSSDFVWINGSPGIYFVTIC
jgi:hypothetical protein